MIVTRLRGGLGNQLFQYAMGRMLAVTHQTELKLDGSGLEAANDRWTYRQFGLGVFNISAALAAPTEVREMIGTLPHKTWFRIKQKLGLLPKNYCQEPHFHFWAEALTLPDGVYLDGYWQSEKYFTAVEPLLRQEFTLQKPFSPKVQAIFDQIQNTEAVSVHVRRGDYAVSSSANRHLRPCPLEYYQRSIREMQSRLTQPTFFVFSDEINWVKKHFEWPQDAVFIAPNAPHEDLWLMAACKHHIIANSTFGWWGAWLNPGPDKIVIAPHQWFSTDAFDTADLLPTDWLRR